MRWLELRIPPPVVALLTAAAMGATARLGAGVELPPLVRTAAVAVLLSFAALCGPAAIAAFRRARTTVDPTRPEKASSLVTTGIYRLSRNPMYLALAVALGAWAVWLAVPWCALGPLAFAGYLTRFQIVPEERVMHQKFGAAYDDYRRRTRRWL